MDLKVIIFITLFLCITIPLQAQDLKNHKWNNRILVLVADSFKDPLLKKQLKELQKYPTQLSDLRLIIYQVTPIAYRAGFQNEKAITSSAIFKKYNPDKNAFKLILIGLDGGVKMNKKQFTPAKDLFDTIDQMPMRRNELNNQQR